MAEFDFGTLGASLISGAWNLGAHAFNAEQQKKLQAQQNAFNLKMWNLQNEYNTPKSQVQRLVDAGLSPNLAYGSVSTGNAQSAPAMHAAQRMNLDPSMLFDQIGQIAQLLNLRADLTRKNLVNEDLAAQITGKSSASIFEGSDGLDVSASSLPEYYQFLHSYKNRDLIHKSDKSWSDAWRANWLQNREALRYNFERDHFYPYLQQRQPAELKLLRQQSAESWYRQQLLKEQRVAQYLRNDWYNTQQWNSILNMWTNTALDAVGTFMPKASPRIKGVHSQNLGGGDRYTEYYY